MIKLPQHSARPELGPESGLETRSETRPKSPPESSPKIRPEGGSFLSGTQTDAYPAFVCQIAPSRIQRFLLLLVSAGSVLAIGISQIPALLQITFWTLLLSVFYLRWKKLHQTICLHHHGGRDDTANVWLLVQDGEHHEGKLVSRGYRSAGLLILAIQLEGIRKPMRLPVWSDSVKPEQFSYLNLQLMFNSDRG